MSDYDSDSFDCPDQISDEGHEFWRRLLRTCEREGIRVTHRWDLVVRYTQTWDLWRECCRGIAGEGQVVEHQMSDGCTEMRRNPRMVDYSALSRLLAQCASEIGLSAKARLDAESDGVDDGGNESSQKTGRDEFPNVVYKIGQR